MANRKLNNDSRPYRITEKPRLNQGGYQVAARPVDTYVRPAQSEAFQLAESLAQFQPLATKGLNALTHNAIDAALEEGVKQAQAWAADNKNWKKAVEEGKVPVFSNPWAQATFDEHMGRLMAAQAATEADALLEQDAVLRSSTNPDDFEKRITEIRDGWIEENLGSEGVSERMLASFNTFWNTEVETKKRPEFIKQANERFLQQASDTRSGSITMRLTRDTVDMPKEELAAELEELFITPWEQVGFSGYDIDNDVLSGVAKAAVENMDYDMLELLEHLPSRVSGVPLADTDAGRELIEKTETEITRKIDRRVKQEKREKERKKEEALNEARRIFIQREASGLENDYTDLLTDPKYFLAHDEIRSMMSSTRGSFNEFMPTRMEEFHNLHWGIFSMSGGTNEKAIVDAMMGRRITREQGGELLEKLERWRMTRENFLERRKARNGEDKRHAEKMLNLALKQAEGIINNNLPLDEVTNAGQMRAVTYNGFVDDFMKYLNENENPSYAEVYAEANRLGLVWAQYGMAEAGYIGGGQIIGAMTPQVDPNSIPGRTAPGASRSGDNRPAPSGTPKPSSSNTEPARPPVDDSPISTSAPMTEAEEKALYKSLILQYPGDMERVEMEFTKALQRAMQSGATSAASVE